MKRVIAGRRAVLEALRSRRSKVAVVYLSAGRTSGKSLEDVVKVARSANVPLEERTKEDLDSLAAKVTHNGVIAIAGDYRYASLESLLAIDSDFPLLVALDQITDPHNFGAIIRSAVAFGVDGIIITQDRAAPVTPAVTRASAGATEYARIARVTNLSRALEWFRGRSLQIVGLESAAPCELGSLASPHQGRVLVIGSEGRGLRRLTREKCDVLARIALEGPITSLNASVAAAIAFYEIARRRPCP